MQINSPADIWELVCTELKKEITEISFNVWLKDLKPVEMKQGEFVLSIYSVYKKQIVESNYLSMIESALKNLMGIDITVTIFAEDENGMVKEEKPAINSDSFEDEYTFDNFIVGATNRFAHAASMAVADNPYIIYNPLVIYGRSGVGKTHLLLAIKNHIKQKFPNKKVEYIRCEDFTNQMISSLHNGTMDAFRARFRNSDVLLMDDIQFIAGKESTQEEFFNTFNALYQEKKQIVVTCDRPPKDIKSLDDRIRSRFESGLIADITPPDFETKVGILQTKAVQLNITIPENIIYYIAEHIQDNTRQLEGVVKKIQALILLNQKTPTLSAVQNFIKEVVSDTKPEPIKVEQIISEVARTYNVSENDILSTRRTADLVKARQVAMYIARETTELPYNSIGEAFGKNHTTVLYTEKKVKEMMKNDPHEKTVIEDIIKNLKSE
jgi:chromosomal replication initiator protein